MVWDNTERRNGSASEEIGFLFSFPFFVFATRYEASPRNIIWGIQDSRWHTILPSVLSYIRVPVPDHYCCNAGLLPNELYWDYHQFVPIPAATYTKTKPPPLMLPPAIYPVDFFECRSIAMFKRNDTQEFFPVKRERNEARAQNELD